VILYVACRAPLRAFVEPAVIRAVSEYNTCVCACVRVCEIREPVRTYVRTFGAKLDLTNPGETVDC
jgi:hypothetical protein